MAEAAIWVVPTHDFMLGLRRFKHVDCEFPLPRQGTLDAVYQDVDQGLQIIPSTKL